MHTQRPGSGAGAGTGDGGGLVWVGGGFEVVSQKKWRGKRAPVGSWKPSSHQLYFTNQEVSKRSLGVGGGSSGFPDADREWGAGFYSAENTR